MEATHDFELPREVVQARRQWAVASLAAIERAAQLASADKEAARLAKLARVVAAAMALHVDVVPLSMAWSEESACDKDKKVEQPARDGGWRTLPRRLHAAPSLDQPHRPDPLPEWPHQADLTSEWLHRPDLEQDQ